MEQRPCYLPAVVPLWLLALLYQPVVDGAAPDPYEVLELLQDATPLDVQLAYMDLSARLSPAKAAQPQSTRSRFAEVQQAFEQLSDADTQEEIVNTIDYWSYVKRLDDDEDLQRFAEFSAGSSAHLRIIFVTPMLGERRWSIFTTAAQLYGRARIGQVSPQADWQFFQTLRIKPRQATVIFDPISRASRVKDTLDPVVVEAERLLEGRMAPADKIARVLELDSDTLQSRCKATSPSRFSGQCRFLIVLASEVAFEKGMELAQAMRPFAEGCRRLQASAQLSDMTMCFWLRLGRAPAWKEFLTEIRLQAGVGGTGAGAAAVFAIDTVANTAALASSDTTRELSLNTYISSAGLRNTVALPGPLPQAPEPLVAQDEPIEPVPAILARRLKRRARSYMVRLEAVMTWSAFMELDMEMKAVAIAAAVVMVFLPFYLLRSGRPAGSDSTEAASQEAALKTLVPAMGVVLPRQPGEKLGMQIDAVSNGRCFRITGIDQGGPMDRRNASEMDPVRRVQVGDHILSVIATTPMGKQEQLKTCATMLEALKRGGDITLGIALHGRESMLRCLTGTVALEGLSLQDAAQLIEPVSSYGGEWDTSAVEISELRESLCSWNKAQAAKGTCIMQQLEPGDRVVSVDGSTSVREKLRSRSPKIVIARWRHASALQSDGFEVSVAKTGPEDRLGLQIRPVPHCGIEVLDVIAGGLIARSNSQPSSRQVLPGDRITCVNGETQEARMNKALQGSKTTVRFERWLPSPGMTRLDVSNLLAIPAKPVAPSVAKVDPAAAQQRGGGSGSCCLLLLLLVLAPVALFVVMVIEELEGLDRLEFPLPTSPVSPVVVHFLAKIHPELYVDIAALLLFLATLLVLHFLWYELAMLRRPGARRSLCRQVVVAFVAATLLGFGHLFLLAWAGRYSVMGR